MSGNEKPHKKTTVYDFFIKLVNDLSLHELPKYQKFNLIITILLIAAVLALALPPALALINNIAISIGNVFIAIFGNPEQIQPTNNSISVTIVLPLIIVLVESIACAVLCYFYRKLNNTHSDE